MSDEVVIRHCSPTLAGLKTGSLFSYRYDSEDELRRDIRAMNRVLVPKGLRVLSLRCKQGRALIYLYRPSRLGRDLTAPVAAHLLEDRGYPWGDPDLCVVKLIQQLRSQEEFPHEIGLFLGYPPMTWRGSSTMDRSTASAWAIGGYMAMKSRPNACLPSTGPAPWPIRHS